MKKVVSNNIIFQLISVGIIFFLLPIVIRYYSSSEVSLYTQFAFATALMPLVDLAAPRSILLSKYFSKSNRVAEKIISSLICATIVLCSVLACVLNQFIYDLTILSLFLTFLSQYMLRLNVALLDIRGKFIKANILTLFHNLTFPAFPIMIALLDIDLPMETSVQLQKILCIITFLVFLPVKLYIPSLRGIRRYLESHYKYVTNMVLITLSSNIDKFLVVLILDDTEIIAYYIVSSFVSRAKIFPDQVTRYFQANADKLRSSVGWQQLHAIYFMYTLILIVVYRPFLDFWLDEAIAPQLFVDAIFLVLIILPNATSQILFSRQELVGNSHRLIKMQLTAIICMVLFTYFLMEYLSPFLALLVAIYLRGIFEYFYLCHINQQRLFSVTIIGTALMAYLII